MPVEERQDAIAGLCDRYLIESHAAMAAPRDGNKLVFDTGSGQILCHQCRLLVGNVSILVAMNKQCWWVTGGYVPDRTVRIERLRLRMRIVPRHFPRPEPLLAAVEIEDPALATRGFVPSSFPAADGLIGFLLRDDWLLPVEGVRAAVPRSRNVTVPGHRD